MRSLRIMAASFSTASSSAPAIGPTHPHYATWAPVWRKLAHVYEGSGGFLDGAYIVPHPREWQDHSIPLYDTDQTDPNVPRRVVGYASNPNPQKPTAKLLERRRLARYENVAATIVDQKASALFREGPSRQVSTKGDDGEQAHDWLTWCDDVDGAGTSLDDFMAEAWRLAGIFGHSIILMDRPKTETAPVVQSDVPAPILRLYAALDMPNWLTDDAGHLTAVRLLEAVPRTTLDDPGLEQHAIRVRTVDAQTWKLVDEVWGANTTKVERTERGGAPHGIGRLPVAILYAQRRALYSVVGKSVLADPGLFLDNYNLISETRELLRKQTFSVLNVPLGVGDQAIDIDTAQAQLGQSAGTVNVLFSAHAAQFITADPSNVGVYQKERADLLRTIFRLSAVPWESDSLDAEAEGSLKLKREDMNQILASYGDECERTEYTLAELWFRATYGADVWEKEWKAAGPVIRYPDTFDTEPFEEMLTTAQAALALPLGQSQKFLVELSRRLVARFLQNAPQEVIAEIMDEIEALPTPQEAAEARLATLSTAFAASPEEGAENAAEAQAGAPGKEAGAA